MIRWSCQRLQDAFRTGKRDAELAGEIGELRAPLAIRSATSGSSRSVPS